MSLEPQSKPIGEDLFTWPSDNPALLGSRCQDCGRVSFPVTDSCSACCSADMQVEELPRTGTLWTWTVQRFMPKTPYNSGETQETFKQYGVGYVELADCIRVESRLTENNPDKLKIGMEMELVVSPYRTESDGSQVMGFAFAPVGDA